MSATCASVSVRRPVGAGVRVVTALFEQVQGYACVAVRIHRHRMQRVVVRVGLKAAEAAFCICQRRSQNAFDVYRRETLEHVDLRPRQQRRVHFERRILGRGPNQHNRAGFTCGRNASCCALLKRWISSMKSTVRLPRRDRTNCACAITSLISLIPDVTALNATKSPPV